MALGKGAYGFYKGVQNFGTPVQSIGQELDDKLNKRRALDLQEEALNQKKEEANKYKGDPFVAPDPTLIPEQMIQDSSQLVEQGERLMTDVELNPNLTQTEKNAQHASINYISPKYEAFGKMHTTTIDAINNSNLTPEEKNELINEISGMMPGSYNTNIVRKTGRNGATLYDLSFTNAETNKELSYSDGINKMRDVQKRVGMMAIQNDTYDKYAASFNNDIVVSDDGKSIKKFDDVKGELIRVAEAFGLADPEKSAKRLYDTKRRQPRLYSDNDNGIGDDTKLPVSPYRYDNLVVTENTNKNDASYDDTVMLTENADKKGTAPTTLKVTGTNGQVVTKLGALKMVKYKDKKVHSVYMFVPNNVDQLNKAYEEVSLSKGSKSDKEALFQTLLERLDGETIEVKANTGNKEADMYNNTTFNQQLKFVNEEYERQYNKREAKREEEREKERAAKEKEIADRVNAGIK